jgi:hypothetical protein
LFAVSANGEWEEWLRFCLRGTIDVCRDGAVRCDRLRVLRDTYHDRVGMVNKRMHALIERLFANPITRVTDLVNAMNISYPTARADIDRLIGAEILRAMPDVSPKAFYAPEIMQAAYGEP